MVLNERDSSLNETRQDGYLLLLLLIFYLFQGQTVNSVAHVDFIFGRRVSLLMATLKNIILCGVSAQQKFLTQSFHLSHGHGPPS